MTLDQVAGVFVATLLCVLFTITILIGIWENRLR
jgi:hypothetical protein